MIGSSTHFRRRLLTWYARARRDLPWRVVLGSAAGATPDPYYVLVSEAMLQQTQVATVVPYFKRFIEQFPTVEALANADEQAVLRAWQGLGYYSRARNLRSAARTIVERHGGVVPSDLDALLALPGVGRYTAGAIASLAFGRRAPILDGNVARVLCRIDKIESDPRDKPTQAILWARAEQILPVRHVGDFNSALMELGATACVPRNPQCLVCPVREHCEAFAAGLQDRIPPPRRTKENPLLKRWTFCIRRPSDDRYLVEQRPATGRWAGMWQFVTIEANGDATPSATTVRSAFNLGVTKPKLIAQVTHGLTHRRYEFDVFACQARGGNETMGTWRTIEELNRVPLPKPHVTIARLLRDRTIAPASPRAAETPARS